MTGLVLVGSPTCGPCGQASNWLQQNNVSHRKLQLDGDTELMQWLMEKTQQQTIPQFFFNGQWIQGGFPAVQQMVQQGAIPRSG